MTTDSQLLVSIVSDHLKTTNISSNASRVFPIEKGYIPASEFFNQTEQLFIDILAYYSKYGEWPTVKIYSKEEAEELK